MAGHNCKYCKIKFTANRREQRYCSLECSHADPKRRAGLGCSGVKNGKFEHGLTGSRIYRIWINIKSRCNNPKFPSYEGYGARGITLCKQWNVFANFYKDMGEGYKDHLTIERLDNNKGYFKENCVWADRRAQALNTRNVERAWRYQLGKEYLTIRELAERFNIKRTTLDMRLRVYGWPLEESLGGPVARY